MAKPSPKKPAPPTVQTTPSINAQGAPGTPDAAVASTGDAPCARIAVISEIEGFRRAGRAWSRARTVVDADTFSAEQLAALRAEPHLHVIDLPPLPQQTEDEA